MPESQPTNEELGRESICVLIVLALVAILAMMTSSRVEKQERRIHALEHPAPPPSGDERSKVAP